MKYFREKYSESFYSALPNDNKWWVQISDQYRAGNKLEVINDDRFGWHFVGDDDCTEYGDLVQGGFGLIVSKRAYETLGDLIKTDLMKNFKMNSMDYVWCDPRNRVNVDNIGKESAPILLAKSKFYINLFSEEFVDKWIKNNFTGCAFLKYPECGDWIL